MKQIISMIVKEIKLLIRDPGGFIMLFILPASFIFILSISLQGTFSTADNTEKMDIFIINNDSGEIGSKLIEGIQKSKYFNILTEINGKKLNKDQALSELKKGKFKVIIEIPIEATDSINFKSNAVIQIYVDPVLNNEFVNQITSSVQQFINGIIMEKLGNIASVVIEQVKQERLKEIDKQIADAKVKKQEIIDTLIEFKKTQIDKQTLAAIEDLNNKYILEFDNMIKQLNIQKKELLNQEVNKNLQNNNVGLIVKQNYFSDIDTNNVPTSVQQNVPGWTIFALFWIVQIIVVNIITERDNGLLKRILISPISKVKYLVGKIIPFFLINLIQAVIMFSIGIFILPLFGCQKLVINNYLGLFLITITVSFVAISFGLFIASVTRTLFVSASLSGVIVILMTVLGGIMIPKFIMPKFMQNLSLLVPHGWAQDAYLNLLVRNYSIIEILPNIFALMGFGLVFFIISLINMKRMMR